MRCIAHAAMHRQFSTMTANLHCRYHPPLTKPRRQNSRNTRNDTSPTYILIITGNRITRLRLSGHPRGSLSQALAMVTPQLFFAVAVTQIDNCQRFLRDNQSLVQAPDLPFGGSCESSAKQKRNYSLNNYVSSIFKTSLEPFHITVQAKVRCQARPLRNSS